LLTIKYNLKLVVSIADARMRRSQWEPMTTAVEAVAAAVVDAAAAAVDDVAAAVVDAAAVAGGVRHPLHWDSCPPALPPSCCQFSAYRRWHWDPA